MRKIIGIFFILLSYVGLSQISGDGAYMKGLYVEVGIDGLGGFEGADTVTAPMPTGMHFRSNLNYLGFTANPQMNGWATYDGDFFTPGVPENTWGFAIVDNGGTVNLRSFNTRKYPYYDSDGVKIPGAITGYVYTGGLHTVTWEADYDSLAYALHFTIVYTLHDTALSYNTTFSVSNVGEDIDEFYYFKNIDLDNNYMQTFDYATTNTIVSQPSGSTDLAEVKAEQFSPWYSGFSLSANDSLARVIYGGFSNRNAFNIWHGIDGLIEFTNTVGSTSTIDSAIAISCKMDSLFAFRSSRSFSFTSSFLGDIVTQVQEHTVDNFDLYPNPANTVIHIHSPDQITGVTVYNMVGEVQYTGVNSHNIDISYLSPGIYLLVAETGINKYTRKVIKQ